MMTDPIADMLTRLRNALKARHASVIVPYSEFRHALLKRLVDTGFVKAVETAGEAPKKNLLVHLKYARDKQSIISGLVRVSTPGRRVYKSYRDLKSVMNGLGLFMVSTPKGVFTDYEAREKKMGGEVLFKIW
ncbi:MAG: 30S ribosomal protein S8 [Deltaproteobacteria bacterium]|nr:30S ribosomal protein S8 [Deltaproteobacteria bacterium]